MFDDVQATASNSQRIEESQIKKMDNTESSSPTESDGKKNDIESSSPTASIECEDKSDAKFTSPVVSDDLEEVLLHFSVLFGSLFHAMIKRQL